MNSIFYHPEALGELHAAPHYYYENDLIEIGDQLVAELNATLSDLAEHPARWKKVVEGIRACGPTKKFKWRIVYMEQGHDVFVIAAYTAALKIRSTGWSVWPIDDAERPADPWPKAPRARDAGDP